MTAPAGIFNNIKGLNLGGSMSSSEGYLFIYRLI